MAMQEPAPHAPKSLGEAAVCFSCTVAVLALAAIVLQWASGFVG